MSLPLSIHKFASQIEEPQITSASYTDTPRRASTALRSGNFLHVDTKLQTAVEEAENNIKEEESAESRELHSIAALADHPGWQIVRQVFEERINEYRSGRVLSEALQNVEISDSDIGSMTRMTNLVAGELTTLINKVELAALEDQRQKEERRNATIRERVAGRI